VQEDRGAGAKQQQVADERDGAAAARAAVEVPVAVAAADAPQDVEVAAEARVAAPAAERESNVVDGGAVVEAEVAHDAVDAAEHALRLRQARPFAERVGGRRRHVQRAPRAQAQGVLAPAVNLAAACDEERRKSKSRAMHRCMSQKRASSQAVSQGTHVAVVEAEQSSPDDVNGVFLLGVEGCCCFVCTRPRGVALFMHARSLLR
jgi:hypothetical protein